MKTLNEYCTQVSSIDEYLNTKVSVVRGFPKTIDKNAIIKFLDGNGFDGNIKDSFDGMTFIFDWLESHDDGNPSYAMCEYKYDSKDTYWIRIFRGGKISHNNPVFTLQVESGDARFIGLETREDSYGSETFDYEKFLEKINKHFDW